MYQFQSLENVNKEQLRQCFNLAFSDYAMPIHFTPESLEHYLSASAVELALSFGAYWEDQMVAVILNSAGIYQDQPVVFDAGTGVVPDHRGKKVFSRLFAYAGEELKRKNIKTYYLEVLQSNSNAIAIYKKKGFSVTRDFSVLTAPDLEKAADSDIAVMPFSGFVPFPTAFSTEPSFEHTDYTIRKNPALFEVRYVSEQAYCVYAKRNGTIVQLHYNDLGAMQSVVTDLCGQYPHLMAKNIDSRHTEVIEMLTRIGFTIVTKQFEMAKSF